MRVTEKMDLKSLKIKTAFNNIFKPKRSPHCPEIGSAEAAAESPAYSQDDDEDEPLEASPDLLNDHSHSVDEEEKESRSRSPYAHRALPPVPAVESDSESDEDIVRKKIQDYAASIEKVKDCGWYWGPVSGSTAEKMLSSEPDGSFIVRDSSNENYIFSLSFKLDGCVRHVRIEQDQGQSSLSLSLLSSGGH
jgi:hypothetical protein